MPNAGFSPQSHDHVEEPARPAGPPGGEARHACGIADLAECSVPAPEGLAPRFEKTLRPEFDRAAMTCKPDERPPLRIAKFAASVMAARLFPTLRESAESAMYFPGADPAEIKDLPPSRYRDAVQEGWLPTADGSRIQYWHAPGQAGRPTILFSHGNEGNLAEGAPLLAELFDAGYGVFCYDYHGYGATPGKASEQQLYADLEGAIRHLEQLGCPRRDQILLGFSLGTAVTIDVASRAEDPFRAIVLLSPMTSAPEAFCFGVSSTLPGPIAALFLPFAAGFQNRFESIGKIQLISSPLLIAHGTADPTLPCEMGRRLFEKCAAPWASFVTLEGVAHNEMPYAVAGVLAGEISGIPGVNP